MPGGSASTFSAGMGRPLSAASLAARRACHASSGGHIGQLVFNGALRRRFQLGLGVVDAAGDVVGKAFQWKLFPLIRTCRKDLRERLTHELVDINALDFQLSQPAGQGAAAVPQVLETGGDGLGVADQLMACRFSMARKPVLTDHIVRLDCRGGLLAALAFDGERQGRFHRRNPVLLVPQLGQRLAIGAL